MLFVSRAILVAAWLSVIAANANAFMAQSPLAGAVCPTNDRRSLAASGPEEAAQKVRAALFKGFADRYLLGPVSEAKVDAATATLHAQQMVGLYEISRRSDDSFISIANLAGQTTVVLTEDGSLSVPSVTGVDGDQGNNGGPQETSHSGLLSVLGKWSFHSFHVLHSSMLICLKSNYSNPM